MSLCSKLIKAVCRGVGCDILGYFLWDYDLFSKSYALVRFGISKEIGDIAGMGNNCYHRI